MEIRDTDFVKADLSGRVGLPGLSFAAGGLGV